MDEKTRELIAIGASVAAHCQPCLTHHIAKARELGVEEDAIRAAVETGHMVEKGAMNAMKKHSDELLTPNCSSGACAGRQPQASPCCA